MQKRDNGTYECQVSKKQFYLRNVTPTPTPRPHTCARLGNRGRSNRSQRRKLTACSENFDDKSSHSVSFCLRSLSSAGFRFDLRESILPRVRLGKFSPECVTSGSTRSTRRVAQVCFLPRDLEKQSGPNNLESNPFALDINFSGVTFIGCDPPGPDFHLTNLFSRLFPDFFPILFASFGTFAFHYQNYRNMQIDPMDK